MPESELGKRSRKTTTESVSTDSASGKTPETVLSSNPKKAGRKPAVKRAEKAAKKKRDVSANSSSDEEDPSNVVRSRHLNKYDNVDDSNDSENDFDDDDSQIKDKR